MTHAAILLCLSLLAPEPIDKQYDVEINGARLHFHVRGTDPANPYAVFLHGGPGFSSFPFMATTGAELENSLNIVYLDQRGCGLSPRLLPSDLKLCTMKALVEDIEGVRKHLGIEKWGVIGHSFGGMLGIEYAVAHPDRAAFLMGICSLVSVPMMTDDILGNADGKFKEWKKSGTDGEKSRAVALLKRVDELKGLKQKDPRRLAGAYQLALGDAQLYFAEPGSATLMNELKKLKIAIEKYKIDAEKLNLASEPSQALVENDGYVTTDASSLLTKVSVPTLLIGGRSDGVISVRHLEIARRGIKNAQFEILDDCGHFPFYEQPTKLLGAMLRFVQKQPKPQL